MLFAEPAHPYDDPDQPDQWAWRYGYFELLYTPGIKTLSLSRGPKYSINSKRCCRRCDGSGYLPWWERTTPDGATTPAIRCPTCPTHRTLFEHLPLPLLSFDWLRNRFGARRRTADHSPAPYEGTGPGWAGGYSDEPPF
ncbi:hypothetical protein [Streptomyces parvus]|uniref:hypothetical protein n=1 Tax=Streptomyces parvus TaxID=66428 RepID=UPI0021015604|nr:hypothetical protein [Streptomyces parvus]MCQ1580377.1 hypothetical protein [Streptomyces parvus]